MVNLVITGSHPTPAQALVEQLPKNWRVSYLGETDGPKFKRYDWWGSARDWIKLPGQVIKFKAAIQRLKPAAAVSFGGYPAVPVCWAAKWCGVPVVIHEQTFGAGLASKLTALAADKVAISWESSRKFFPKNKTVLVGNPVRRSILAVKRVDRPNLIYITGGHQGAQAINRAIEPILPRLCRRFIVYHQYGLSPTGQFKHQHYHAQPYFNERELGRIYAQARLVIGRSGINTVTELAYLKIPALLIPLPYTQVNEQMANARFLESLGLALALDQTELCGEKLAAGLETALSVLPRRAESPWSPNQVAGAAVRLSQLLAGVSRDR